MAGFKTHITVSTMAGVAYGATAYSVYQIPLPTCMLAGGLCSVSGMLPDIDSDSGRPLRESLSFAAAVVSMMLAERFRQFGMPMESIILAAAMVYLGIRFGVSFLLQRYTVHRGMFHSIPAAAIFGELAFLLAPGDVRLRYYQAGAVVIGYMSHLILDEIYSVQWKHGRIGLKNSFGTALKLYSGKSLWPNVSVYGKLAIFTLLALKEPGWMSQTYHDRFEQTAQKVEQRVADLANEYGLKPGSAVATKADILPKMPEPGRDPRNASATAGRSGSIFR